MMLGKRGRPPVKRTASMTEFTLDFTGGSSSSDGVYQPLDPHNLWDQRMLPSAGASPRGGVGLHRRNSADSVETAHFLRVCSLCQRRLIPGRDIYMYRGDSAFCSEECRQQQMTQDEAKDKCSLPSKKDLIPATAAAAAGARVSAAGGTIAAV